MNDLETDRIVNFFCYIHEEDHEQALNELMLICRDAYLDGLTARKTLYPNGKLDMKQLLKLAKRIKKTQAVQDY